VLCASSVPVTIFIGAEAASPGRNPGRRCAMGDKGKKDKEKSRKQKLDKETQAAKKAQEKIALKLPFQKS
jgi:hypothetical protein